MMVMSSPRQRTTTSFSEMVTDRKDTVFGLTVCQDAVVWVGEYAGSHLSNSVKFLLGENQNSLFTLTNTSGHEVSVGASGELSCEEERYFWISWRDEMVAVGRGVYPGTDVIVSIKEATASGLSAVFYDTENQTAQWDFHDPRGRK